MKINEDSLRDLWDNTKCPNILTLGGPRRRREKEGPEEIFEVIIAKNCTNMRKETKSSKYTQSQVR